MKEKSVSPVIGAVLLIAITVVLVGIVAVFAGKLSMPKPPITCVISVDAKEGSDRIIMMHKSGIS